MKNLIIACLCLMAVSVNARTYCTDKIKGNGNVVKKERVLSSFSKVSIAGSIDLIINQNGKEAATVETDENIQDVLITEVKDNELHIHLKKGVNVSATKMVVHLSCVRLNEISSGGSGDVSTTSALATDKLEISHGGSGDFMLDLNVKKLEISTGGSGDYKLKGNAAEFELSAAGSGDIYASPLNCTKATISMAGSGDVQLRKGVKAEVSSVGSGKVTYE